MGNNRVKIIRSLMEDGKTLEVGVRNNRVTNGDTIDCVPEYNPTLLCDLNEDNIPCEDNVYDTVIAGEVLEHLNNPYRVTREFHRILKPGGKLIISVPNISCLVNRIKMLYGKLPNNCARPVNSNLKNHPEKHHNDFNLKYIKELLEECDFEFENILTNGIYTHHKLFWKSCPVAFGEILIIKCSKPFY